MGDKDEASTPGCRTPYKMGPTRVSLLTGSVKRTTPYKILSSIDRRQRLFPSLTQDDSNISQSLKDVTIGALNVTETDSMDSTLANKSIKKACLDWRLVNKEAEVIRLKTEQTQLQSLIGSIKEDAEKSRIQKDKEIKDLEDKLSQSRKEQRDQERRIIELEGEIESLREERQQEKESLLPEREYHESQVTQLKLNECKLRGDILELKQEIKSLEYNRQQEIAQLNHELKLKDIEVSSLEEEKKVFERHHETLKQEAQQARQLRLEMNKLMMERDSLRNQLRDFEDGQKLSQLLQSHNTSSTDNSYSQ